MCLSWLTGCSAALPVLELGAISRGSRSYLRRYVLKVAWLAKKLWLGCFTPLLLSPPPPPLPPALLLRSPTAREDDPLDWLKRRWIVACTMWRSRSNGDNAFTWSGVIEAKAARWICSNSSSVASSSWQHTKQQDKQEFERNESLNDGKVSLTLIISWPRQSPHRHLHHEHQSPPVSKS